MTIQAQIDALPSTGGTVFIGAGDFTSEGIIYLPSYVALIGENPSATKIRGVKSKTPAVRTYGQRIENLTVQDEDGYIGVDLRRVSTSILRNLIVSGFQTGVFYSGEGEGVALYNLIEHVFADSDVSGLEFYNGANQNTVIGGKFQAPTCVNIIDSNGNSLHGTSCEYHTNCVFVNRTGYTAGTVLAGVRGENPAVGTFNYFGKDGVW